MSEPIPPVEVNVEVSGTPEQVWELVATGPGISTWFMPATVEPRIGGLVRQRHGTGDDDVSQGTVSAYDAPHRFRYDEEFDGRTLATEFLVEARSGGTCVVRVVTSGLTTDDAGFADGMIEGWTQALCVLRVYLAAFAGRPAASSRLWTRPAGTLEGAWGESLRRAGLEGAAVGEAVDRTAGPQPPFAGVVELVQERAVLVRVDAPRPGVLSLIATEFGGEVSVVVDRYVYADRDSRTDADAERDAWDRYLAG